MMFKGLIYSLVVLVFMNSVVGENELKHQYRADFRSVYDQELYESVLDTQKCEEQLNFLANHSLRLEFIDASAKIPPGILTGNVNDLGDYYQCLSIDRVIENMEIQGKYCAITVPLDQPSPIQIPEFPEWEIPEIPGWPGTDNNESIEVVRRYDALRRYALGVSGFGEPAENRISPLTLVGRLGGTLGICVPKVCTATQAIDFFMSRVPFLNFTYNEFYCRLPNDKLFSPADYVATVILSVLLAIVIISTTYDLYHTFYKRDARPSNPLMKCFSVYTNTRRFLTFNSNPLECVDGIRAISMMWVIVGHTYAFTLLGYIHNMADAIGWLTKFSSTWINSAPITVDTFFCLSGILAVYTTVGKTSKARFIRTIHLFYINRLLRMFPILATAVLLQASLFNHFSDGPFWLNISQQAQNCRTWWWTVLLHVQNYVNPEEICIPQTWYLSVDVQLYFFCPVVIVWLFDRRGVAWTALCAIVLVSLASSTTYSFIYDFSAGLFNPTRIGEFAEYSTKYYVNTLTRAPPFFVGMIYGYLLHIYRDKQLRISKLNVMILWSLSFLMMAFCVFSIYPVMQADHERQLFDNFLNAYMRAIWACALGWMIFACVHGYGGAVNWFLSLRMWKLPARMSFAVYAVHVSIIMVANGSWVKTHYFSDGDNMYRFFSDVTITFLVAFVLSITIDAPFSTLQKLLLGGGAKKPVKPLSESRNNIIEDDVPVIKTTL